LNFGVNIFWPFLAFRLFGLLDVIQVTGSLGENDITWGQANNTGVPPNQKVNKAE
jgi:hypothetical protein